MSKLINIGFGNSVPTDKILAVCSPSSTPIRRKIDEARENGKLIDASFGRKTRSVLFVKTGYVILSGIQTETIQRRYNSESVGDSDADE